MHEREDLNISEVFNGDLLSLLVSISLYKDFTYYRNIVRAIELI